MPYIFGIPALLIALYFAACEVIGTFEYMHAEQGGWNYVVFAAMGIAAVLAVLPAYASFAFNTRPWLSLSLWGLFAASLIVVVAASVGRTGGAADQAQSARSGKAQRVDLAVKALTSAEAEVSKAEDALSNARAALTVKSTDKNCLKNCADMLKENVATASADLERARARRDAARDQTAEVAPVEKHDPLYRRIAAASFGLWNEDQVRTAHPIAVPVLTSLLSAAFMAVAVWCFGPLRQSRRQQADTTDEQQDEALPRIDVEDVQEHRPLALPVSGPGAAIAEFVARHVTQSEGDQVSMRDLLALYEDECDETGEEPIDRAEFARELAALCQRLGIKVKIEGREAYIVGAAMAA